MQRTLITFIGTGDYSETVYHWRDVGECPTPHIAVALANLWKASGIVILATQDAEDKNGASLRETLAAAGLPEPAFWRLPDGRTEDELWSLFQILRTAMEIAAGGEVLVDITHGFRAQPFFAGAVLSVLRAAGLNPESLTVVYGEYRKNEPTSPIWDLTLFAELIDWAQALSLFLRTGVAGPVVQLGRQVQKREADRAQASISRSFPKFGPLVGAIERFADDLATIRVASIITGYEQDDSRKRHARGSAAGLVEAIAKCRQEVAAKLPPLALILDQLAESVEQLSADRLFGEDGQRAQNALARHYLALTRYPEAAVVVREGRINRHAHDERAVEVNSPEFNPELRSQSESRFADQDLAREISNIRNDIEHGGFRKQPLSAKALQSGIDQLVDGFAVADKDTDAAKPSSPTHGRTYFVTRHPGATEWAARQGIAIDRSMEHLDLAEIQPGDVVIGTLPVQMAAEVCARRARYFHLALELPREHRGLELSAEEMTRFGARLLEYQVRQTHD